MLTALLALVVLAAYTTQAMIGFGANIIALTIGAHLWPLETLLPLIVALNLPLSGTLVWRHRQQIAWAPLRRAIAPLLALGFVAGMAGAQWLQSQALALGFGLLVCAIAAWELARGQAPPRAAPRWQAGGFLLLGGLAQGLYASGGPFVAYAVDRMQLGRAGFRATLLLIWLVTNSILLGSFAAAGRLDGPFALRLLAFLPLIAAGLWLGERLHHSVSEAAFRRGLYLLLLAAGGALVLRQLAG